METLCEIVEIPGDIQNELAEFVLDDCKICGKEVLFADSEGQSQLVIVTSGDDIWTGIKNGENQF